MLAEYRGKVVVLVFYVGTSTSLIFTSSRSLTETQQRFKGRPLAILALHDASLRSLETFRTAVEPLIKNDYPPSFPSVSSSTGHRSIKVLYGSSPDAGETGSGRTADIYENYDGFRTFVIDKNGSLVLAAGPGWYGLKTFSVAKDGQVQNNHRDLAQSSDVKVVIDAELASLMPALEDQLGLPRSPVPDQKPAGPPPRSTERLTRFKGRVVDPDGKPIVGAKVTNEIDDFWQNPVQTGPNGEFLLNDDKPEGRVDIKIEAPGFATRVFKMRIGDDGEREPSDYSSIDTAGAIRRPLAMGRGVEVTGRVSHAGKPVGGVTIGLKYVDDDWNPYPFDDLEAQTDDTGIFRFPRVLSEQGFWAYAKLGSLPDGGAIAPIRIQTNKDGSTLDVGELHVEKGRTLAGRLVCLDGKPVPDDLELDASNPYVNGELAQKPGPNGRFQFKGLPGGPVALSVFFRRNGAPSPYRLSAKNLCLNPYARYRLEGQLDHDITDLTILFEPGVQPEVPLADPDEIDPAVEADFNDSKAGPITGVPPQPSAGQP